MRPDDALLLDMLLAARKTQRFVAGMWQTVQADIPPLITQLEQLVPPEKSS
jgi:hypothetical protein